MNKQESVDSWDDRSLEWALILLRQYRDHKNEIINTVLNLIEAGENEEQRNFVCNSITQQYNGQYPEWWRAVFILESLPNHMICTLSEKFDEESEQIKKLLNELPEGLLAALLLEADRSW